MTLPLPGWQCWPAEVMCGEMGCRYWVRMWEVGNCVLRVERGYGTGEIARALGVSRGLVWAVEKAAMGKMVERMREVVERVGTREEMDMVKRWEVGMRRRVRGDDEE